jgi:L-ascorbate metabolism protein UlaG (beta-lactamase superfamily)
VTYKSAQLNSFIRRLVAPTLMLCLTACAGFGRHRDLLVADELGQRLLADTIRITYLGTNGYLLVSGDQAILIDPYFTRLDSNHAALDLPIQTDSIRVNGALLKLGTEISKVKAILITHAHFDHLLDAPDLSKRTGAVIVGSPTACFLAGASGTPQEKLLTAEVGEPLEFGPIKVTPIEAEHDRLWGVIQPFPGRLTEMPAQAPTKPSQWVTGKPLAFLIEWAGKRIYIDSGGTPKLLLPAEIGPVDLAILGVALPGSRQRYVSTVNKLNPRFVLPSHQDDFFVPLSQGFKFGPTARMELVRRAHRKINNEARLILLDYFEPWTLR